MKDNKRQSGQDKREDFIEGVDYYFENDLMILTGHFLRKRGYCCRNGCRHCPYSEINILKSEQKNL